MVAHLIVHVVSRCQGAVRARVNELDARTDGGVGRHGRATHIDEGRPDQHGRWARIFLLDPCSFSWSSSSMGWDGGTREGGGAGGPGGRAG